MQESQEDRHYRLETLRRIVQGKRSLNVGPAVIKIPNMNVKSLFVPFVVNKDIELLNVQTGKMIIKKKRFQMFR